MKRLVIFLLVALIPMMALPQGPISRSGKKKQNTTRTTSGKKKPTSVKKQSVEVSDPDGFVNDHGYVDLGLSVKWATCNVGASSPSDYGDYYAWGETSTNEENCKTYGESMNDIGGNSSYDVARDKWGGSWRLPTEAEFQELIDKCTWTWTTQGGHNGYKVTGKNGKSIFLPAAGWRDGTSLNYVGKRGGYWSSTPNEISTYYAYSLYFYSSDHSTSWGRRYFCDSVRPVLEPEPDGFINDHGYVDLGLSVKWATCNVGANSPSDYGDYYAWGETSTKSSYIEYNSNTRGKSMSNIGGNSSHDVARYRWGGSWRLPTKAEFQELIDKCTWTWTTQGDHNGYKVTSKTNGKSIFLPAAGYRDGYGTSPSDVGDYGCYWGSTPDESDTNGAYDLHFKSSYHDTNWDFRCLGLSVRPVVEPEPDGFVNDHGRSAGNSVRPVVEHEPDGFVNDHGYVDLGLSVKWATCNVGASSPSDYGDYYAWGETSTKSSYTEDNSNTYGKSMNDIGGNSSYDVARYKWGGSWRLPTEAEFQELIDKCTWTWTTQGGHNGYKVTGKNGKSIFLPAAGWRCGTSPNDVGEYGDYWSSTPYEGYTFSAYYLYFNSSRHSTHWGDRDYGLSVRPVVE